MRRLTPIWILVLVILAGIIYLPGYSKHLRLKRIESKLAHDMERLQSEIKNLRREEHLLKTDLNRLEEVAREELGLVKPGEIVYRVIEEPIPAPAKRGQAGN